MIAGFFGMNLWNTVWQEDQTVFYWVFGELRIPGGARMGPVMRGASARASSPGRPPPPPPAPPPCCLHAGASVLGGLLLIAATLWWIKHKRLMFIPTL